MELLWVLEGPLGRTLGSFGVFLRVLKSALGSFEVFLGVHGGALGSFGLLWDPLGGPWESFDVFLVTMWLRLEASGFSRTSFGALWNLLRVS